MWPNSSPTDTLVTQSQQLPPDHTAGREERRCSRYPRLDHPWRPVPPPRVCTDICVYTTFPGLHSGVAAAPNLCYWVQVFCMSFIHNYMFVGRGEWNVWSLWTVSPSAVAERSEEDTPVPPPLQRPWRAASHASLRRFIFFLSIFLCIISPLATPDAVVTSAASCRVTVAFVYTRHQRSFPCLSYFGSWLNQCPHGAEVEVLPYENK